MSALIAQLHQVVAAHQALNNACSMPLGLANAVLISLTAPHLSNAHQASLFALMPSHALVTLLLAAGLFRQHAQLLVISAAPTMNAWIPSMIAQHRHLALQLLQSFALLI